MLWCGDVSYEGRFGKALWLLCQNSPLLLICHGTKAVVVCLSVRYDLEKYPQQQPICHGFVPGRCWGCWGLSMTVLGGSPGPWPLPSAVLSEWWFPLWRS